MITCKSSLYHRPLAVLLAAVIWTLPFPSGASAQSIGTIDAGTTITVRTNEKINASNSGGRVFSGVVDQDVVNTRGNVAIPRGSDVELLVRNIANNQIALDRRTRRETKSQENKLTCGRHAASGFARGENLRFDQELFSEA
jgi:hypothetical protein